MPYRLGPRIPASEPPPVVQHDCPCARCGYNLRGLQLSRSCPECAAPIAVALTGPLLRFADRAYLKALDTGLTVLLCSIWFYVLLLAASIVAAMLIRATQSREFAGVVSRAIMLLPAAGFLAGYFLFTTADPSDAGRSGLNVRLIIRLAAAAQVLLKIAGLGIAIANYAAVSGATTGGFVPPLAPVAVAITWGDIAAFLTLFFAVLVHVRAIAARVPDVELRARAKGFMWFLPAIFVGGLFIFGVGPIAALVLFASLLQSLQQHFKESLDWQERGGRFTFR